MIRAGKVLVAMLLSVPLVSLGAENGALHGTVSDPLGSVVASASVSLLNNGVATETTTTDASGAYRFPLKKAGRYLVQVSASTFQPTTSGGVFVSAGGDAEVNVTLATQTLTQQVTVTATGTPTPEAQVGAAVAVLNSDQYRYSTEVQDPLRLIPGLQVVQAGQIGGTTGLFIRGGNNNANKVLVDGVQEFRPVTR